MNTDQYNDALLDHLQCVAPTCIRLTIGRQQALTIRDLLQVVLENTAPDSSLYRTTLTLSQTNWQPGAYVSTFCMHPAHATHLALTISMFLNRFVRRPPDDVYRTLEFIADGLIQIIAAGDERIDAILRQGYDPAPDPKRAQRVVDRVRRWSLLTSIRNELIGDFLDGDILRAQRFLFE